MRRAHRAVTVVLHVCLLLSLWRAPVPWVHAHDSLDDHAADTQFWSEHLGRFHADLHGHSPHGWHWHFVFPWELADKHDDEQHPRDIPESLRIEPVPVIASWIALVRSPCEDGQVAVVLPDAAPSATMTATHLMHVPIGVQVLLTFSNRISWRALACLARC